MFALTPIVRRLLILWVALWLLDVLASLLGTGLPHFLLLDPGALLHGAWESIPGLVGYTLLHNRSNLFHLLGNAWMFALFAPEIERLFPGRRFWELLLHSALAGSLATLLLAWWMPDRFSMPVLGASGLVATVFAASAAMYPGRILHLILFRVRLLHLFLALTAFDLLGFLAQCAGQGKPVAYAVHLAGALVGWMAVGGFRRFSGPWQKMATLRIRHKEQRRQQRQSQQAKYLDEILAKISREGMQSLSTAERKFLLQKSKDKNSS